MKKLMRTIGMLLVVSTIFASTVSAAKLPANVAVRNPAEITCSAVTLKSASRKAYFNKRYKKVLRKCKKKKYNPGKWMAMIDMRMAMGRQFKLWDKELNYVYGQVSKTLTASQKKALVASEVKWIKKRDRLADREISPDPNLVGTLDLMNYVSSNVSSTKKRIKWLIKNYA